MANGANANLGMQLLGKMFGGGGYNLTGPTQAQGGDTITQVVGATGTNVADIVRAASAASSASLVGLNGLTGAAYYAYPGYGAVGMAGQPVFNSSATRTPVLSGALANSGLLPLLLLAGIAIIGVRMLRK